MDYRNHYKYYIDLNYYIIKDSKIHGFLFLLDYIFIYLSIIDGMNIDFNNEKIKIYSPSNLLADFLYEKLDNNLLFIIITFFIILNMILNFFYPKIFCNSKITNFYINYNELLNLRLFSIFYFAIYSKFKKDYLFLGVIFLSIFIGYTEYHFYFYHNDFFTPKFVKIPFDYFSQIFDECLLILKCLISFSLLNQAIKNLIFTLSFVLLSFLTFYVIYIKIFSPIYYTLNSNLNLFRFSLQLSLYFIFLSILCENDFDFFSLHFIILKISIIINSFFLIYIFNSYPSKPVLKPNSDLNIYYYFLYYYHDNYERRIDFINSFKNHFKKCNKKCLLCKNYEIDNDESSLSNYNAYFFIIKLLMDDYNSYKINNLEENKKILIYILVSLSFPIIKNKNIYQYLTLFLIYKVLSKKNKNEILNIKILIKDVNTINKFIKISSDLIHQLQELFIVEKSKIKIETIFKINELSNKLKKKKLSNVFKSNSKKDIRYQLTICTLIYEELFNSTLNKNDLIQLREHYQDIEDTLNLYDLNKQFTLKFDIFSRKMTFLRSGKEFHKYINHNFSDLFPNDLLNYQKNNLKRILYSTKKTIIDEENLKNIKLIIRNPYDKKLINLIKLKFGVNVQNDYFNIIIIDGIYKLYQNIIISYIIEKKELFYGCGLDTSNSSRNNMILLKDFLRLNNIKEKAIKFDYSFKINNIEYKIYKYGEEGNLKEENHLIGSQINDGSHSLFIDMKTVGESSVSSESFSTFKHGSSQFNIKGKSLFESAKNVNIKFYFYQRVIIIFMFILFFLTMIQLFIKIKRKNSLIFNYNILTVFRNVSKVYFYLVSSFRGATCLILKNHTECINYLREYNKKYNLNLVKYSFDIIKYFYVSNRYNVEYEINNTNELWHKLYKTKDKSIHKLFSNHFLLYDITNILDNGSIVLSKTDSDFENVFKTTINSFTVLGYNDNYIYEPFFVLDFPNKQLLNFIKIEKSDWRIELYNIMFNYEKVCENLEIISTNFSQILEDQLNEYINLTIVFLLINFGIEIIEVILIIVYLSIFENVLFDIYEYIRKKVQNEKFNEVYINKLNNLRILTHIYSIHPKLIIEELNENYLNYDKLMLKKKQNEESIIPNKENQQIKKTILAEISKTPISVFSQRVYQLTFVISSLMFVIFLIKWLDQLDKTLILFQTINDSALFELNAYQFFSLYQRSLYTTTNINDMKNYKNEVYTLQALKQGQNYYRIIANEQKIKNTLFSFENKSNSCEEFYNNVKDEVFIKIREDFPNDNFVEKLIEVCEVSKFLNFSDYNFQNQRAFGLIYRGMMSVTKLTENNREKFFLSDDFYESAYFNYLFFKPMRIQITKTIFIPSIDYFMDQITLLFTLNSIVEFIYEILFLIVVVFMLVIRINKLYKKILSVTKIIKINPEDHTL